MTGTGHGEPATHDDATAVEHAAAAAEAIRAINHLTRSRPMPAPLVYEILGHLADSAYGLRQALGQITTALGDSVLHYELTDAPPTVTPSSRSSKPEPTSGTPRTARRNSPRHSTPPAPPSPTRATAPTPLAATRNSPTEPGAIE